MPFREPENAANPVRSGGVLSLWSRSGELKGKLLPELPYVTGASRGAGCSAQFGWYRGYYSRPMERSVGRLFSSHFINFYWEDPMKELAKQYDPSQVEDRIYQFWTAATSTRRLTPTRNPWSQIGRAVQQECRDRYRMPSSA